MTPAVGASRVLLADDSRDTREMFAMYLRICGYRVVLASNGQQAVFKARNFRPDVIIMDLQMPKMDGWTALRMLRADTRTAHIPVIILTGHDLNMYLEHSARAEGAASYMMKPVLPERLVREITECLAKAKKSTDEHRATGS